MEKTMKAFVQVLAVLVITTLVGCASSAPPVVVQQVIECSWPDAPELTRPAPAWVCDIPMGEDFISAVGVGRSTKATNLDIALKKDIALAHGRKQMADQLKVQVRNMFREATTVTGLESETIDKVTDSVSQQITDQALVGARPFKSTTSPKGTLYIQMRLDAKVAEGVIKEAMASSFNNKKALWAMANGERLYEEMNGRADKLKSEN